MDDLEFKKYLIDELHISNVEDVLNKFSLFEKLLIEWNEKFNLTRIVKHDEVLSKHFLDSIISMKYVDFHNKKVADLGSGAGFPGIPLAILFPDSSFILIEANGKKCSFLNEAIKQLHLENITVKQSRIEEVGLKEQFDLALSRAVSELNILLELSIPLLKVDGSLIAYKVFDNEDEIKKAEKALEKLHAHIEANYKYSLPFSNDLRSLILIKKLERTNLKYPRNYSDILKKPL